VRSWRQGLLDGGVAEAVCVDADRDAVEVDVFQFSKLVRDVRVDDDLLARLLGLDERRASWTMSMSAL